MRSYYSIKHTFNNTIEDNNPLAELFVSYEFAVLHAHIQIDLTSGWLKLPKPGIAISLIHFENINGSIERGIVKTDDATTSLVITCS